MCGICGIVSFDRKVQIDVPLITRMMRAIEHRGPDDKGYHLDESSALGHVRLSIIDVAQGHQPIYNEDKTSCIVFNGEIYNYLDLRAGLVSKGHVFSSRSDTEVILHLYEEEGFDCVKKLRGMFAFAIWDQRERILFIARDRLGIKPLYYNLDAQSISFSSEIKSLLATGLVQREANPSSVDHYLALNYTIGPETILRGIKKLMPGHYLVCRNGRVVIREYWDFNQVQETASSFENCLEQMKLLIEESIKMRLMSEVPLGAFLSGGVDSSVTVGVMTRLTGKPVKTFTVGYEDAEDVSELSYARKVARHFNADHYEFELNPRKFMDIVSEVVWHLDEPVAEFATIPLLLLSKLAKEHVTVMLSGEGADEIFAGYPIYRTMRNIDEYQKLPAIIQKTILTPLLQRLVRDKKGGKYADWLELPVERRYLGNGSYFTPNMRDNLYSEDFKRIVDWTNLHDLIDSYYAKVSCFDVTRRMLYLDTKTWLPEDLLIKADKMTMAAAVELRVPFLDHKLVEFAASLPSRFKATAFQSKYIFKKYAEELLPKEIVYRKKRGFPVPVRQWLRGELNAVARDILLSSRTKDRGYFKMHYVEWLFDRHATSCEDLSTNIWNLLILEVWMRLFLDGDKSGL